MPSVKPFKALRPKPELAPQVSCLPYDVMNTAEAREMAETPASFLRIVRSEIDFPDTADQHSRQVYEKAAQNLNSFIADGILFEEEKECFYIYRQTMEGRTQTGLVALCDTRDYMQDKIKKHENTLPEKELDRLNHFKACGAQTEPVFFIHKYSQRLDEIFAGYLKKAPEYDFVSDDGIGNELWIINNAADIEEITELMAEQAAFYIADGHHRTASAAKAGAQINPESAVMAVIFSEESLYIMDYNRLLHDTADLTEDEFLGKISEYFDTECFGETEFKPAQKHDFAMYFSGNWYRLSAKENIINSSDPVDSLDASILQNSLFSEILEIHNPRTTKRLSFAGGIRGYSYLKQQVDEGKAAAAFGLFPVSVPDLLSVADNNRIMPPKSTWFEPKLRSGLFIYRY